MRFTHWQIKWFSRFWPPFLGNGIRVSHITKDFYEIDAVIPVRRYNTNLWGTIFGGALFAMTDAFHAMMLIQILGKEYYIWDKAANIDFVAPARTTVTARFRFNDEQIADIVAKTKNGEAHYPQIKVDIVDEDEKLVAVVNKVIYIKRKPRPQFA